jgi:hypothetical protein
MQKDNNLPQPDYTICPKHYCFQWLIKGGHIARGFHSSLEEASLHWEEILESGCGSSFGICLRDERFQGIEGLSTKDWYEPCEPALDADGLPHDYFIAPKQPSKVDTTLEKTKGGTE